MLLDAVGIQKTAKVLMDFIDKDVGHLSCQLMAATIKMD